MIVGFNELPGSVRQRWVELSRSGRGAYLLRRDGPGDLVLAAIALFFVPAVVLYPLVVSPTTCIAAPGLAIAFALAAYLAHRLALRPPYPPGVYFYASYVVRAHPDGRLELARPKALSELTMLTRRGRRDVDVWLNRPGFLSVPFRDKAEADAAIHRWSAGVQQFQAAEAARDLTALQQLDPFWECTTSGSFSSPAPGGPRSWALARPLARALEGAAALFGALLGVVIPLAISPLTARQTPAPSAALTPPPIVEPLGTRLESALASREMAQWLTAVLGRPDVRASRRLGIGVRYTPPPEAELGAIEAAHHVQLPRAAFASLDPIHEATLRDAFTRALSAALEPMLVDVRMPGSPGPVSATLDVRMHVAADGGRPARFRRHTGIGLVFHFDLVLDGPPAQPLSLPREARSYPEELGAALERATYTSQTPEAAFYEEQVRGAHAQALSRLTSELVPR